MYAFNDPAQEIGEETAKHVQISVPAFVHELCKLGISYLKEVSDDIDVQVSTNKIIILLHELLELIQIQPLPDFCMHDLRHELGYLAKHFRQTWESNSKNFAARTKYLVTINILSRFLQISQDVKSPESSEQAISNDTCFPHKPHYNPAEFETINSTNQRRLRRLSTSIHRYTDRYWNWLSSRVTRASCKFFLELTRFWHRLWPF